MFVKQKAAACFHGGAVYSWIGDDFCNRNYIGDVIDADVLDAWFDPSPKAIEALQSSINWALRSSPPAYPSGVIKAIAKKVDLDEGSLVCGAGSSSLMFLALRELLSSNSRVLLFNPTYGEYAHICTNVIGCHVEFFNLDRESNFVVDLARLSERVCGGAYDLVIIVNPNNPTGQLIERKQLEATIASFPARTKTWIDEAYIDYAGAEHSLARFAATRENVFVCKSLSKVLALSGLRVASLVGNKEQIDRFKLLTPPWSLSLPAQLVLVEALNDLDYYSRCYKQTHELRRKLQDGLRNLGFDVLESTANFLLVEYSNELPEAAALIESCRSRKLLLRDVRSMGSATSSHCFRVAVKQSSTNSKMLSIIATVLEAREKS